MQFSEEDQGRKLITLTKVNLLRIFILTFNQINDYMIIVLSKKSSKYQCFVLFLKTKNTTGGD